MSDRDEQFRLFVAQRSTDLLRLAYLLCGEHSGAEDLLQNALVRAYPRWSRITNPEQYVRRVLVTVAADEGRRRCAGGNRWPPGHLNTSMRGTRSNRPMIAAGFGWPFRHCRRVSVLPSCCGTGWTLTPPLRQNYSAARRRPCAARPRAAWTSGVAPMPFQRLRHRGENHE